MLRSEQDQSVLDLKIFNSKLRGVLCYAYVAHSDIRRAMTDANVKEDDVGGWLARNSQNQTVVCHCLAYNEINPWKDVTSVGRIMEVYGMATVKQLKDFVELHQIKFEKET